MAEATETVAAGTEEPKKKGRPKGTGTKATGEPKPEKTIDQLQEEHAKLREKEIKLLADMAIKKHPELEVGVQTITNYIRELQKSDAALKAGADTNLAKERERLQKVKEHYQNKIAAVDAALSKADTETVIDQLRKARQESLVKLGEVFATVQTDFEARGVKVEQLIPTVQPYLDELSSAPKSVK